MMTPDQCKVDHVHDKKESIKKSLLVLKLIVGIPIW